MRDKWDEKRGAKTYGEITIENALAVLTATYTPPHERAAWGLDNAVEESRTIQENQFFLHGSSPRIPRIQNQTPEQINKL
jgi:hypothetical protein